MKESPAVVFASEHGWKIGRGDSLTDLSTPADSGTVAIAGAIAAAVSAALGTDKTTVILALPSAWCLAATVALAGVPNRNRRRTLLYKLELLLPIPIEEITADYLFDEPDTALAVCVVDAAVKPFADALESAGIVVGSIVPASVSAVHWLLSRHGMTDADAIVWQSDSTVELWSLGRNKIIVGWSVIPAAASDLFDHLHLAFPGRKTPLRIITVGLRSDLVDCLKTADAAVVETIENLPVERAVMSAVRDQTPDPIDLRRDGLAPADRQRLVGRKYLEVAVAAAALVVCVCVGACLRAVRLEHVAEACRDRQTSLFREAFPGRPVPPNILARLRSERRALTGPDGASATTAQTASAVPTIKAVLTGIAAVPPAVRVQVQDFRAEDATFSIDGTARNRADLTALLDTMNQTGRLQTSPDQTEAVPGVGVNATGVPGTGVPGTGIHFVLEGSRKPEAKPR